MESLADVMADRSNEMLFRCSGMDVIDREMWF